jgi:anti-sigma regulatory factor (Ser/Thr protein kinase)
MRLLGKRVFPATPDQVAIVRRWAASRHHDGHPAQDDCALLVSETFTNAIRYSSGDQVEVTVFGDAHAMRVEVVDGGGGNLPHYVDDPRGEGGRGLPILRALAGSWGFEQLETGRLKVWFVVGEPAQPHLRQTSA